MEINGDNLEISGRSRHVKWPPDGSEAKIESWHSLWDSAIFDVDLGLILVFFVANWSI